MKRGLFIVFEGLDKCGKSTQVKLLYEYLVEKGIPCRKISFPERSSKTGVIIDQYLSEKRIISDTEIHELFSTNRWEFNDEITDALNSGEIVIADRYAFSGSAYSMAKGLNPDWCKMTDRGLVGPDIVFYIAIRPEEAAKRKGFGKERFETLYFQKNVSEAFKTLKDPTWVVLNGLLSESQLHEVVISHDFSKTVKDLNVLFDS